MTRSSITLLRTFARDRGGAAAVELGFLLPMLAILLAGTVDIGRALWQHQTAVKAARDSVRYLTRVPAPWDNGDFVTQAEALAETGMLDGTGEELAPNISVAFTFPAGGGSGGAGAWYGSERSVLGRVSFDFEPFTGFGLIPPLRLEAAHIERHIGE